ncbi:MAG: PEGA domain-containing protein [Myxococcales bacterium]
MTAVAFFASAVCWAPGALADGGGSVALLPITPVLKGAADPVADRVTALLASELGKSDALRFVPLGAASAASTTPTEVEVAGSASGDGGLFQGAGERALARGKGLISRAEKEMRRLRFDQAAQDLQSGITDVESSFDQLGSFQVLVDAYLALAIAKLRLGLRDDGEAALEAVVRLAPDLSLAHGHFPAVFVRMHRQAHDKVMGEQGTLTVTSTVPGQEVVLDGRDAGQTPATLQAVAGRHFVIVRGAGGQLAYRVDVPPGGAVQVGGGAPARHVVASAPPQTRPAPVGGGDVRSVRDEIRSNLIDGPGDEALRRIARGAGAQYLVVGGLHAVGDGGDLDLDLFLYAAETDQLAPLPRVRFDGELLGARIEIYKAVQALAAKAKSHGFADALTLPVPVAADYNPTHPHKASPPVAATEPPPEKAADSSSQGDEDDDQIALTTGKGKAKGAGEARATGGKAHTVEASDLDASILEPPPKEEIKSKNSGGLGTWGWIGITVGALALVAGGIIVVEAVTAKPSGGAPTVSWSTP